MAGFGWRVFADKFPLIEMKKAAPITTGTAFFLLE
jgi:hypothetical protein